jgi:hypothetical protein
MKTRIALLLWAATAGFVMLGSCGGNLDLTGPDSDTDTNSDSGTNSDSDSGTNSDSDTVSQENPLIGVDCGTEAANQLEPCSTEGAVCAWSGADASSPQVWYQECACREAAAGDYRWNCYQHVVSQGGCPEAQPEQGGSCVGYFGTSCYYPERVECDCDDSSGRWECTQPKPRPDHLSPPPLPSAERLITELDDAERGAWCGWFVDAAVGPGYAERSDAAVDEDGYTVNTGCAYGVEAFPCNGGIGPHSRGQCAENLALSSCEAPISELTDCVATIYSGACVPLEHGCARFFDKPGCSGTIVVDLEGNPEARRNGLLPREACAIRVR